MCNFAYEVPNIKQTHNATNIAKAFFFKSCSTESKLSIQINKKLFKGQGDEMNVAQSRGW